MAQNRHGSCTLTPDTDVVRVAQLTDTHLCRAPGGTLLGMDTDHSLQAVIDLVKREREGIDVLLATGDLSDGGAREAYERLQVYFTQLPGMDFWLPGNHDDRAAMESVAATAGRDCLSREIRAGKWQILMLDSQVAGEVGGELGEAEMLFLARALREAAELGLYSLVCLHHHPVPIDCQWLDEQMVADADTLFALLSGFPRVRAVLWGHVHQEIDRQYQGMRLLASPSTCVQFAPGSVGFKADDQPPGYRWLDLHPDGSIETGVSRVWDVAFNVELDSGGYL
jgi:Icc protein